MRYLLAFLKHQVFEIQFAFYTYSTFQSGPATFQALESHTWLVASEIEQPEHCSLFLLWLLRFK